MPKALPPATATMGRRPGTRRRSFAISTMASCAILGAEQHVPHKDEQGDRGEGETVDRADHAQAEQARSDFDVTEDQQR
jgi:hypothetical protein